MRSMVKKRKMMNMIKKSPPVMRICVQMKIHQVSKMPKPLVVTKIFSLQRVSPCSQANLSMTSMISIRRNELRQPRLKLQIIRYRQV